MVCFKIPDTKLRLFLVALDMNFQLLKPKPDYIFQVDKTFKIVFIENPPTNQTIKEIDTFVEKLWIGARELPILIPVKEF